MRKVSPANKAKFKWYVTKVLAKVVDCTMWNKGIYYYTTPLKARMDMSDPDSLSLFTVSNEAMICLIWENNWEKWQKQFQYATVPENAGKQQPSMPGKWSTSTSGQKDWGGWSDVGLEMFNTRKKEIRAARKGRSEEIRAFEEKILAELRKEAGIDCYDADQQLRKNRAKKRKLNADLPVEDIRVPKIVRTVDEEDEDDEEN